MAARERASREDIASFVFASIIILVLLLLLSGTMRAHKFMKGRSS